MDKRDLLVYLDYLIGRLDKEQKEAAVKIVKQVIEENEKEIATA